jgi:hypothetical protein
MPALGDADIGIFLLGVIRHWRGSIRGEVNSGYSPARRHLDSGQKTEMGRKNL